MFPSFRFDKFLLQRLGALCMMSLAAGATAVPGGDGGGGGGGGGAPGGTGGTGTGGGGTGAPPAQPGAQGGSPSSGTGGTGGTDRVLNWADAPQQFREAHDALKSKYEPWGKLAEDLKLDHTVVGTQVRNFQTLVNEAYDLGEELGYSEEQIRNALTKNMVGTLHWLRGKKTSSGQSGTGQGNTGAGAGNRGGAGQGPEALEQRIAKMVQDSIKPYQEDLTARQAETANRLFDNTCTEVMKAEYKESFGTMPDAVKNLLLDAASELFKYDEGAAGELFKGKTAKVQAYFAKAKTIVESAFVAWQQWQTKLAAGAGGSGGNQGDGQEGQGQGNSGNAGGPAKVFKGDFLQGIAEGSDEAFAELRRRSPNRR